MTPSRTLTLLGLVGLLDDHNQDRLPAKFLQLSDLPDGKHLSYGETVAMRREANEHHREVFTLPGLSFLRMVCGVASLRQSHVAWSIAAIGLLSLFRN